MQSTISPIIDLVFLGEGAYPLFYQMTIVAGSNLNKYFTIRNSKKNKNKEI